MLIGQGDAKLDNLEQVHIASERLEEELGLVPKVSQRPSNHPGELGVHGDVGVLDDQFTDRLHLGLQRICPHIADDGGCPIIVVVDGRG